MTCPGSHSSVARSAGVGIQVFDCSSVVTSGTIMNIVLGFLVAQW